MTAHATTTAPNKPTAFTCAPTPCDAGGAVVRIPHGTTHAVIEGPSLRAVDILCDDALRILDVRDCRPGVHVTFVLESNLDQLLLPDDGPGAVLHLQIATTQRPFFVDGAIDHFDAAWLEADETSSNFNYKTHRRDTAAAGGYVGPPDGGWQRNNLTPDVLVLVGGAVSKALLSNLGDRTRFMLLHDCTATEGVHLTGHVQELAIRASTLSEFTVDSAQRISMQDCNDLARIQGDIAHLAIRGGGAVDTLRIDGYVGNADIAGVACQQLEIPAVRRMKMRDVDNLERVITLGAGAADGWSPDIRVRGRHAPAIEGNHRGQLQPLTADDIYEVFVHGTPIARAGMIRWASQCEDPTHFWLALRVLAMAVDAGEPADDIWDMRGEILRRHTKGEAWAWAFPEDLAARGWTADVRLWLRCVAAEASAALDYPPKMTSEGKPEPIGALLLTATGEDITGDERTLLLRLALFALRNARDEQKRLDVPRHIQGRQRMSEGLERNQETWLWHGVRALTKLAEHRMSGEVADTMSSWFGTCAPTTDGVRLIGRLAAHGSSRARWWLMQLRSDLPRRDDIDDDTRLEIARAIAHQLVQPPATPRFAPLPPGVAASQDQATTREESA